MQMLIPILNTTDELNKEINEELKGISLAVNYRSKYI